MASEAQIEANRNNAKLSTGPTSPEGKAKSAANARRHGLLSNSDVFFSAEEQNDFRDIEEKLFKECLPGSELELQTFRRYTFNVYQLMRAQRMEVEAQEATLLAPDSDAAFARMERMVKLSAILERRADKRVRDGLTRHLANCLPFQRISSPFASPLLSRRSPAGRRNCRQTNSLDSILQVELNWWISSESTWDGSRTNSATPADGALQNPPHSAALVQVCR